MTDLIVALYPVIANSVGTSTVDLSVDDIYDGTFQLQGQSVPAPFHCVLHPVQLSDFRSSLRGEGGAIAFSEPTAEMLKAKGPGFAGSWLGIDFYAVDSVTESGGNKRGCLYNTGAFAWTMAPVGKMQAIPDIPVALQDSQLLVEIQRVADFGATNVVGHIYPAVAEAEDLRAVQIVTDA
jgi:hypothetical protein